MSPSLPRREPVEKSSFFHWAANFSILTLPVSLLLLLEVFFPMASVAKWLPSIPEVLILTLLSLVAVLGVLAGLLAVCGHFISGTRELLWKGLGGIFFCIILLAFSIYAVIPKGSATIPRPSPSSPSAAAPWLVDYIVQTYPKLPLEIDASTRIDKVEAVPASLIVFTVTLANRQSTDVFPGFVEMFLRPYFVEQFTNSPDQALLRERGATLVYKFLASDGTFLGKTTIDASDLSKIKDRHSEADVDRFLAAYAGHIRWQSRHNAASTDRRQIGAALLPHRTLLLGYTLRNAPSPYEIEVDTRNAELARYRDDPFLKFYRDNDVTIVQRFYDSRGGHLGEFVLSPADLHTEPSRVYASRTTSDLQSRVARAVQDLPRSLDDGSRLDSIELLPHRTILRQITLPDHDHSGLPEDYVSRELRPPLVKTYNTSPDLEFERTHAVTLLYRYRDRNGLLIGETSIGPDDLGTSTLATLREDPGFIREYLHLQAEIATTQGQQEKEGELIFEQASPGPGQSLLLTYRFQDKLLTEVSRELIHHNLLGYHRNQYLKNPARKLMREMHLPIVIRFVDANGAFIDNIQVGTKDLPEPPAQLTKVTPKVKKTSNLSPLNASILAGSQALILQNELPPSVSPTPAPSSPSSSPAASSPPAAVSELVSTIMSGLTADPTLLPPLDPPADIKAMLRAQVEKISAAAPSALSEQVRMDGAEHLTLRVIVRNLTLPQVSYLDMPTGFFEQQLRPALVEKYNTDPAFAAYRRGCVTLAFRFRDRNDFTLGSTSVGPGDLSPENEAILRQDPGFVQDNLSLYVEEMNEKPPPSDLFRLNGTALTGERTITYQLAFVNYTKDTIPPDEIQTKVRHSLLDEYRTGPHMERFRRSQVTLVYVFRDQNGEYLDSLTIGPDDLN